MTTRDDSYYQRKRTMSISDIVAQNEAELLILRNQVKSLETSNSLLIEQNEQLKTSLENLRIERDSATRRASDVLILIKGIGEMSLEGVKRMMGEGEQRQQVRDTFDKPTARLAPINYGG